MRRTSETARLAVVRATDAWLSKEHHLTRDPDGRQHTVRRSYLRTHGKPEWAATYSDLSQTMHGEILYIGQEVTQDRLDHFFLEAAEYVEGATGESGLVEETLRRLPGGGHDRKRD